MGRILIIGAGGVGSVIAHKCAQIPDVFSNIAVASRSMDRMERLKKEIKEMRNIDIDIQKLDADKTQNVVEVIKRTNPDVVVNAALGYQNYPIMNACLETGVHYLDTATPEIREIPGFDYYGQWAYNEKFKEKGILGVLGCGFDPGVTSIWVSYAKKHFFDRIRNIDILDCNAGNHGKQFATNFDPEINIREITLPPRYWKDGHWVESIPIIDSNSVHFTFDFPVAGKQEAYLLYHEELESLGRNYPELMKARFWMTFGEKYLKHLRAIVKYGLNKSHKIEFPTNNISPLEVVEKIGSRDAILADAEVRAMFEPLGLLSDKKITFPGNIISPVQMLGSVLPKPDTLGANYTGYTSICDIVRGEKDGRLKEIMIWQSCDHAECYRELKQHGISYTAGVPAFIGAKLIVTGEWKGKGVFNPEQLNPDPFMRDMNKHGLPWKIEDNHREFIRDF